MSADARDLPAWAENFASAVHRLALSVERYQALIGRDRFGVDATGVGALAVLHLRGPLTPRQIATAINLSPPATTELLDRLDNAGYIARAPHPTDRRKILVTKTPIAEEVAAREWTEFVQLLRSSLRDADGSVREVVIAAILEACRVLECTDPAASDRREA